MRHCVVVKVPTRHGYVVTPQKKGRISFGFKGLDLSILNYAGDILNLSRTISSVEGNISLLSKECAKNWS